MIRFFIVSTEFLDVASARTLAGRARSFVALTKPRVVSLIVFTAVIGMLPGIDLNARLALVPLLNLSLVCKEMLSGVWHWNYIAIIFGSSCVYAAVALWLAVKMFNREDVIFRA